MNIYIGILRTWDEHLRQLKLVLQLLSNQQFQVNRKKRMFGRMRMEYLGNAISQGVAMDPSKVSCGINWPIPKSPKCVCGSLGITGYYRRFKEGYGSIAQPLTQLHKEQQGSCDGLQKLKKHFKTLSKLW